MFRLQVTTLILGASLFCAAGCGDAVDPTQRPVAPALGRVLFKGEPIPDASIRFHPVTEPDDGKPVFLPRAIVDEAGNYFVTTYSYADGAPVGEYRVSLSWQGPMEGVSEDDEDKLKELLPKKYTSPASSGITVVISEGQNIIPEILLN
ncbi:MAG: hypothetical protein WAO83_26135 [Fuerstiella sp.]|jgi:hypothetical protein